MSRRGRGSILAQSDKAKVHEVFAILNLDDHPSGGQEVLTLPLIKLKVKIFDNWIFDAHYPAYCRATAAIFIISRARPRCAMASENDCVVIITIVLTKRVWLKMPQRLSIIRRSDSFSTDHDEAIGCTVVLYIFILLFNCYNVKVVIVWNCSDTPELP